jgi:hypothetical protein
LQMAFRKWRYELSVALLSETHPKPHESFFVSDYHFYRTDSCPQKKGILHTHVETYATCAIGILEMGKAYS